MTKPKIALMTYAIDNRPAKGTAIVARKCVEELLKAQDQFDLTFVHYDPCTDPVYSHGVREVLMPKLPWPLNRRSLRQILYFFTAKDRFDIMQWFQPRLYPFFWLAPARKIIVEVHGAGDVAREAPFDVMRIVFNWTVKTFIKKITKAIVASEFAKKDIVAQYGFAPEQVRVIHNGADPSYMPVSGEKIQEVRKTYALPEKFFVGVGRLNPNKNVFRTLQAFETFVAETGNSDMHFVNVGAQGTDKENIDTWLATSSVKDRIHFIKFVENDDLPGVYCASYALVFPLLNEGFGLPAIEAMACGIPTVVSHTAYPEIDKDETILVDPLDVKDIARGMRILFEDTSLRERIITKGFAKAKTLTWEKMGEGLMALYREVLR